MENVQVKNLFMCCNFSNLHLAYLFVENPIIICTMRTENLWIFLFLLKNI